MKAKGSVRTGNLPFSKGHAALAVAADPGDPATRLRQPGRLPLGVVDDLGLMTRVNARGSALASLGRPAAVAPTIRPVLQP